MFWKVIAEKIFSINLSKNVEFEESVCCANESVRDVAKLWQRDMVHQALFVKTNSPLNCATTYSRGRCGCKSKCNTKETCCRKKAFSEGDGGSIIMRKISKQTLGSQKSRVIIGDHFPKSNCCKKNDRGLNKKLCKCTSVRVRTIDVGCDARDVTDKENEELRAYKINLEFVERTYNDQKCEIERLTRENTSLKGELEKCNNVKWKTTLYCPGTSCCENDFTSLVPKPFECCVEDRGTRGTDSEMLITMKNCKNEVITLVNLSKEEDL